VVAATAAAAGSGTACRAPPRSPVPIAPGDRMTTKPPEVADFKGNSRLEALKRSFGRLYQIPGLRRVMRVVGITAGRLYQDDGWAMASHLTLSALMALFPFLILVAAVGGFLGAGDLADQAADFLFQVFPEDIAGAIYIEVQKVLSGPSRGLLTASIIVMIYLASSGVDAVRAALTRAYGSRPGRRFWVTRLQTLGFVFLGSFAFLALALLGVLGPLIWTTLQRSFPDLVNFSDYFQAFRYIVVGSLLAVALTASHLWLPGRGDWRELRIWPGIVATLVLWWIATSVFAAYLETFANYYSTYAGLASIVTSLFYLYIMSLILIFGAEFNAAIARTSPRANRRRTERKEQRDLRKGKRPGDAAGEATAAEDDD
jgi:membrane protein